MKDEEYCLVTVKAQIFWELFWEACRADQLSFKFIISSLQFCCSHRSGRSHRTLLVPQVSPAFVGRHLTLPGDILESWL